MLAKGLLLLLEGVPRDGGGGRGTVVVTVVVGGAVVLATWGAGVDAGRTRRGVGGGEEWEEGHVVGAWDWRNV